jgi:hypothetical protein
VGLDTFDNIMTALKGLKKHAAELNRNDPETLTSTIMKCLRDNQVNKT